MRETLTVDCTERHRLSPYLYMQFMEPLGATDGSVAAAWDYLLDDWRGDVVEAVKDLAPPMIRWGGCLSSYYRWREGIGPRTRRIPMVNLLWGGIEPNNVGTHEFVDLCRRVGAVPFFGVNFESDGHDDWARPRSGGERIAGPEEAAEWVDYCNNPDNRERIANGAKKAFDLRIWQIGNETSYHRSGFDVETAGRKTLAFARAMRKADPSIELIGWGDSGWAPRMLEICGDELRYLAFHHMIDPENDPDSHLKGQESPINGSRWRSDTSAAWDYLMEIPKIPARKIERIRSEIRGLPVKLAKTEGHYTVKGRNRGEILATWAAGVSNALILNVHERNGDILDIATHADFCGNRWLVNALMIPTPRSPDRPPYLLPAGRVMALFGAHSGERAVEVGAVPAGLDVTASRSGNRVFMHLVNTGLRKPVNVDLRIEGRRVERIRVFEIAGDPFREIDEYAPGILDPAVREVSDGGWTVPSASVSAVEIDLA